MVAVLEVMPRAAVERHRPGRTSPLGLDFAVERLLIKS